jgi:sigma-E factor negative regulatory protein RseA
MSNEALDSQLSAMFDGQLHEAECELLARRLSRDPALKARWERYALISAVLRGDRGMRLDIGVAQRVAVALAAEPLTGSAGARVAGGRSRFGRWQRGLAGGALAAGVAALSIFWLRAQNGVDETLIARSPVTTLTVSSREVGTEPDSYTVPAVVESPAIIPTAELANYVVAHSEFTAPLVRRNTLSTLMASEAGSSDEAPAEDENSDAR